MLSNRWHHFSANHSGLPHCACEALRLLSANGCLPLHCCLPLQSSHVQAVVRGQAQRQSAALFPKATPRCQHRGGAQTDLTIIEHKLLRSALQMHPIHILRRWLHPLVVWKRTQGQMQCCALKRVGIRSPALG